MQTILRRSRDALRLNGHRAHNVSHTLAKTCAATHESNADTLRRGFRGSETCNAYGPPEEKQAQKVRKSSPLRELRKSISQEVTLPLSRNSYSVWRSLMMCVAQPHRRSCPSERPGIESTRSQVSSDGDRLERIDDGSAVTSAAAVSASWIALGAGSRRMLRIVDNDDSRGDPAGNQQKKNWVVVKHTHYRTRRG